MAAYKPPKTTKTLPPVKPLAQTKSPGAYANEPAKASKSKSAANATTPIGKYKGRATDVKSRP